MTPPRIVLLGGSGQLGHALQRSLAPLGEIIAPSRQQCDLYNPAAVQQLMLERRPDIIVNAAAHTAVDEAEHHPALAMQLNAALPALLAEIARGLGAWLVHFSSDYVYDGDLERPYRESDPARPLNTYGRSKLAGDEAVATWPQHLIIRTGWVFHRHGANFVRTILRRAQQQTRLQVVNDQFGAPNSADFLANCTAHLITALRRGVDGPGLYHVATQGRASWYDVACQVLHEAERLSVPLRCPASQVRAISSQVLGRLANRPASCVLDTSQVSQRFGLYMPPWQHGVGQVVHDLVQAQAHSTSTL